MNTNAEERSWGRVRENQGEYEWAAGCATVGAAVWAGIAVLGRLRIVQVGAIELLFLFAPLVIVPLGMELGRRIAEDDQLKALARRLQAVGAALVLVAMVVSRGRNAGLLAIGWLVVCVLMAGSGVMQLGRALWSDVDRSDRATRVVLGIASLDLLVGGIWLVVSRWGMRPLGIEEPIGLLTAVHFHFAGFATAMIAVATLRFAERRGEKRWLKYLVWIVAGAPLVVAAGFVISPAVKMVAAVLFSASVAGLAIVLRACGRRVEAATARILLQVAAGAIFVGMVFSGAYAIADYVGWDALTIPQMIRTHGILNAVGFCLSGLLGWLVEDGGSGVSSE
jgi:YndJ-like protein